MHFLAPKSPYLSNHGESPKKIADIESQIPHRFHGTGPVPVSVWRNAEKIKQNFYTCHVPQLLLHCCCILSAYLVNTGIHAYITLCCEPHFVDGSAHSFLHCYALVGGHNPCVRRETLPIEVIIRYQGGQMMLPRQWNAHHFVPFSSEYSTSLSLSPCIILKKPRRYQLTKKSILQTVWAENSAVYFRPPPH